MRELGVEHDQLAREFSIDKLDLLLLQLANQVIKESGHRYGFFLEAASTAAKLSIYLSFLENGRNFRKTGIAHHVEPKRVKEIVKEMEHALKGSSSLKGLGATEPSYLIGIPHLWKEKYAWQPGKTRIFNREITESEDRQISLCIPSSFPEVQMIDGVELTLLIEEMHWLSQEEPLKGAKNTCSDSLLEHIKYRLLCSETIVEISLPFMKTSLYALASNSYAPKGRQVRLNTMIEDTLRFIHLLKQWVEEDKYSFRAIETMAISSNMREQAFKELDELLQQWGDKYHCEDGEAMLLQMALGKSDEAIL